MGTLIQALSVLKRYRKDEGGNIAMLFGLVFMTLLLAVGVGYDYSQLTHAYAKSQSVADQTALQAAIYVKNHGAPPTSSEKGMVNNQWYTAEELGHHYNSFVKDGASGVKIKVKYDSKKKEATAIVEGKTVPAFLQVFNYENLHFNTKSVANYEQLAPQDAASIVLVLDNSGSMWFDDKKATFENGGWKKAPNGKRRINGLKESTKDFMDHLETYIGPQTTSGERVLRTGLLAYNEELIGTRTVLPKWGTIDDSKINAMTPGGATNSSPPMTLASTWLTTEPAVHFAETGEDNPLKFVIFMTDGQNNEGNYHVVPGDTDVWWRYSNYYGWQRWNRSDNLPAYWGYEEGTLELATDSETLAACTAMKAQGVKIYTIAFALQPGWYYTNEWGVGNDNPDYFETEQATYSAGNALMAGCASDDAMYIQADDSQALEKAFNQIANHIVTELIRLKS